MNLVFITFRFCRQTEKFLEKWAWAYLIWSRWILKFALVRRSLSSAFDGNGNGVRLLYDDFSVLTWLLSFITHCRRRLPRVDAVCRPSVDTVLRNSTQNKCLRRQRIIYQQHSQVCFDSIKALAHSTHLVLCARLFIFLFLVWRQPRCIFYCWLCRPTRAN